MYGEIEGGVWLLPRPAWAVSLESLAARDLASSCVGEL